MVGEFVIVRSRNQGVVCGTLVSQAGDAVLLSDARQIYRWRGANTLFELSQEGAAEEYTRISKPVPKILILEACGVIPCSKKAEKNLSRSRWPS